MNIYEKLTNIQNDLKAPKNQFNHFGKYKYRNLEDVLEALKPLLLTYKVTVNISDEVVLIGERYYIKSTATLFDIEKEVNPINSVAYAREDDNKKGMDLSQLSGSTSSYARKYALNGLFAIDDTKDSDTTNTHGKEPIDEVKKETVSSISEAQIKRLYAIGKSKGIDSKVIDKSVLTDYKKDTPAALTKKEYDELCKRLEAIEK